MDPLPLIPKTRFPTCADVSDVVRDVFQDILVEESFTDHTLDTIQNFRTENYELQNVANNVEKVYEQHKISINDISVVETTLMTNQGRYLKTENKLAHNHIANENMLLRRHPVFKDLSAQTVEKYALVQADHLLPSIYERSIDFTLCDSERNHYKTHLDGSTDSILKCSYKKKILSRCVEEKSKQTPLPVLVPLTDCHKPVYKKIIEPRQDELDIYLRLKCQSEYGRKSSERNIKKNLPVKLIAEPKEIVFYDYEQNVVYEQTIKLRNVGTSIARFLYSLAPEDPRFVIIWNCKTTALAPGMFTTINIRFRTDTYQDALEYIFISVMGARDAVVKISTMRDLPMLMGILYYGSSCLTIVKRNLSTDIPKSQIVLNSTIDCKATLIGKPNIFSLLLENHGSDSTYFIMSEWSWHHMRLKTVTGNNLLHIAPFKISPAYFTLKSGGIVEIVIEFLPEEFGFHIDKAFILCDNCTHSFLDFIGDGIYYEADFVQIKLPTKKYKMDIVSDFSSEYVLHMGSILPYQSKMCAFRVVNTSILKIPYRWKLRPPELFMKPNNQVNHMSPNWICIDSSQGILPSELDFNFKVSVKADTDVAGLYQYVLELYVTGIPEESLQDYHNFTVEETGESNVVDVLIGGIELWLDCVEVVIYIDPCLIEIRGNSIKVNDSVITRMVKVFNMTKFNLKCAWRKVENKIIMSGGSILISPMHFQLPAKEVVTCEFSIQALDYAYIEEVFVCEVNDSKVKVEVMVKADVAVPLVTPSTRILNFGIVKFDTKVTKNVTIRNDTEMGLEWSIAEYALDISNNRLIRTSECHLNADRGYFCHKGSVCYLEYTLGTQRIGKWCSLLLITTSVSSLRRGSDVILVYADVIIPLTGIYAPLHATAILMPPLSFVESEKCYSVSLRNHTAVPITFAWGTPEGNQLNYLDVKIWPNSGVISQLGFHTIIVTIKPLKAGHVTDFMIPCFIGRTIMPIYLYVDINVQDIQVIFELGHDISYKILWPPMEVFSSLYLSDAAHEFHSVLNVSENNASTTMIGSTVMQEDSFVTSSSSQINDNFPVTYPSGMTWTTYSSRDSYTSLKGVSVGSDSTTSLLKFVHSFERDCESSDMYLEFRKVPLKTPNKQTIVLRNETPIKSEYSIHIKNFRENDGSEKSTMLDRVKNQIKHRTRDELEHCLCPGTGVVVSVKPPMGILEPYGVCEIDIWVYADTWGFYLDELTCVIPHLHPFHISVFIEIVGHPVLLPMAALNNKLEANLRFGTFKFGAESVTRKLKIKNTACIPIAIVWHVFIKSVNDYLREEPFSFLVDLFSPPSVDTVSDLDFDYDNTKFDVMLRPYFGHECTNIINVNPKEIYLNSQSSTVIEVTFSTDSLTSESGDQLSIHALLIGDVKIARSNSYLLGFYRRSTGYSLEPVKVNVFVDVIVPYLHLELVQGDIIFKVWASTILSCDKGYSLSHRVFVLRNNNPTRVTVQLSTTAPFRVLLAKSALGVDKASDVPVQIAIAQNSCAEIFIECFVTVNLIRGITNMLLGNRIGDDYRIRRKTVVIDKTLTIDQPGLVEQNVPLELHIGYPEITISKDSVSFGPVYLGCTQSRIVSLTNRTTEDILVRASFKNSYPEFDIQPATAVLPGMKGQERQSFDFLIFFKPLECKTYQEIITFSTYIESYWQNVHLTGLGSHNSKFFFP